MGEPTSIHSPQDLNFRRGARAWRRHVGFEVFDRRTTEDSGHPLVPFRKHLASRISGAVSFSNHCHPNHQLAWRIGGPMIITDRTAEASRITMTRNNREIYSGGNSSARRNVAAINGIILHHTNFFNSDPSRYDYVIANYVVMADGRVLFVRPLAAALNSVATDHHAVDIEFEGVYPNASGARPTAPQMQSGRELINHLRRTNPGIRRIFAHRHFRNKPCCGPYLWYNLGRWAQQQGMSSTGAIHSLPSDWEVDTLALAIGNMGGIIDPWTGAVTPGPS